MRRRPIETFPNPHPRRDYVIRHVAPEFTSVCPKTGQPDFGAIEIEYVADRLCVELKGLKLYLQGYRNTGVFYEDVVNRILDDLVAAVQPRRMTVTGSFTPRGGIHSIVTATYERPARAVRVRRRQKRFRLLSSRPSATASTRAPSGIEDPRSPSG
jgi:7-cyano-7-deazaguanine reductase